MAEDLYERALDAIRRVFTDKTQSVSGARISLNSLRDEIGTFLSLLPEDDPDPE